MRTKQTPLKIDIIVQRKQELFEKIYITDIRAKSVDPDITPAQAERDINKYRSEMIQLQNAENKINNFVSLQNEVSRQNDEIKALRNQLEIADVEFDELFYRYDREIALRKMYELRSEEEKEYLRSELPKSPKHRGYPYGPKPRKVHVPSVRQTKRNHDIISFDDDLYIEDFGNISPKRSRTSGKKIFFSPDQK